MTQAELGEAIGTTGAVISLLESGDRKLSPKWLHKLAPALKTRPGFLLDYHPDDVSQDIMDTWVDIPVDRRTQAMEILQTFRGKTGTGN